MTEYVFYAIQKKLILKKEHLNGLNMKMGLSVGNVKGKEFLLFRNYLHITQPFAF